MTLSSPLSAEVPTGLRRRDGLPGHERHGAPRHTTRQTLTREGEVLDALVRGRHAGVAVAPPRPSSGRRAPTASGADQTAALRRICQGGERLACVVGPAGAGKTRMVRAARDAWAADGTAVRGLAVSAVAAGVLAEEAGIPADTVAKFLHDTRRSGNPSGGFAPVRSWSSTRPPCWPPPTSPPWSTRSRRPTPSSSSSATTANSAPSKPAACSASWSPTAAPPNSTRSAASSTPGKPHATLRLRNGDESVLGDYEAHGRIARRHPGGHDRRGLRPLAGRPGRRRVDRGHGRRPRHRRRPRPARPGRTGRRRRGRTRRPGRRNPDRRPRRRDRHHPQRPPPRHHRRSVGPQRRPLARRRTAATTAPWSSPTSTDGAGSSSPPTTPPTTSPSPTPSPSTRPKASPSTALCSSPTAPPPASTSTSA